MDPGIVSDAIRAALDAAERQHRRTLSPPSVAAMSS